MKRIIVSLLIILSVSSLSAQTYGMESFSGETVFNISISTLARMSTEELMALNGKAILLTGTLSLPVYDSDDYYASASFLEGVWLNRQETRLYTVLLRFYSEEFEDFLDTASGITAIAIVDEIQQVLIPGLGEIPSVRVLSIQSFSR